MTPELDIQKAIKEAIEDLRKRPIPKPKIIEVSPEQYESGYRAALLKFRDRLLGMVDAIAKELDDNA